MLEAEVRSSIHLAAGEANLRQSAAPTLAPTEWQRLMVKDIRTRLEALGDSAYVILVDPEDPGMGADVLVTARVHRRPSGLLPSWLSQAAATVSVRTRRSNH